MLKKYIRVSVILITLFSCFLNVNAYEFIDPSNESSVNDLISEIYDAKEQYEDLVGNIESDSLDLLGINSIYYWWPIGSDETTTVDGKVFAAGDPHETWITSHFGYRVHPITGEWTMHSGTDISGSGGNGVINIIAVKSGIVVYPYEGSPTNCPSSNTLSDCGGGYGNYVVIQHSDGNYSLYAHLHADTITVKAGDSVEQGQVIAKMGSSGNSTGTHLHFEIREGQNYGKATVDALNYVSLDNPRIVSKGDDFIKWLNSWEGHTPIDGDSYVVIDIGDNVRTVGGGVTLENNPQLFKKYGIDINDYPVGSKIPISIVDQMELEIVDGKRSYIESVLAKESIVLRQNEIDALVSQTYNIGNIVGFADAYKKYGNTQALFDNWMFRAVMKGTQFEWGLTRRRNAEWAMFHRGEYLYSYEV